MTVKHNLLRECNDVGDGAQWKSQSGGMEAKMMIHILFHLLQGFQSAKKHHLVCASTVNKRTLNGFVCWKFEIKFSDVFSVVSSSAAGNNNLSPSGAPYASRCLFNTRNAR